MGLFLGVDGGGTKTAYCVVDGTGCVRGLVHGPSTYQPPSRVALLQELLRDGVHEVCAQGGVRPADLTYAFFGLPGYGEASDALPQLDAAPRFALGHDRYRCDNDMVCGWAGSLALSDGINVISGTGSMTYGEHGGRRARTGGWGELFGDEGSAHWIAVRGLSAFTAMSDGRAHAGPLHGLLRDALGVTHDLDAVDVVLNHWQGDRRRVAALAPVVVTAAADGDPAAQAILEQAAGELVALVTAARHRLEYTDVDVVPVSFSGGVFRAEPVRQGFRRGLAAQGRYDVRTPVHPPHIGAALYAARCAGERLEVALQG